MKIRLGTRKSKLAMWQTEHIASLLQAAGAETSIFAIETKGDKILDRSLSKIGSKGVFTEELETMLRSGEIDIAVHSAKDVQSVLPEDLPLIAFGERESAEDVILSLDKTFELNSEKLMGTSSTRRVALLKNQYPGIETVSIRGNLQTRFKKLQEGQADALVLAYAGVHRMEMKEYIVKKLPIDNFTTPVGQGAIAIQTSTHIDSTVQQFVTNTINHRDTELAILAERAYLKEMDGGCSIPSFGFAQIEGDECHLRAGIISLDGKVLVKKEGKASIDRVVALGQNLAQEVLEDGGREILTAIKKEQNET